MALIFVTLPPVDDLTFARTETFGLNVSIIIQTEQKAMQQYEHKNVLIVTIRGLKNTNL